MRGVSPSVILCLCVLILSTEAVDRSKFKKCDNTPFCKRNRATSADFKPQDYELVVSTVRTDNRDGSLTAELQNNRFPLQDRLACKMWVLANGVVRMVVSERNPMHKRYEVQDVLQKEGLLPVAGLQWTTTADSVVGRVGEKDKGVEVLVSVKPFSVIVSVNGKTAMAANSRGLMTVEQYRGKNPKPAAVAPPPPPPPAEGEVSGTEAPATVPAVETPAPALLDEKLMKSTYDEEGMWDESFGSHHDSKPRGPASVGLDISFIGASHVYGIPEHASSFALKSTTGSSRGYSEPYRLWNLDVFEYELDEPMALYGAVPLMLAHDEGKTVGFLWLNAAETYIDIADSIESKSTTERFASLFGIGQPKKDTHWISESGAMDMFFLPGPTPYDVFHQYATLTGYPALPQQFAVAYHQCRWNYKNEEDVAQVDAQFDAHDIPYDVLWLDIEHTDGKKYFTWDKISFPSPVKMQEDLAAKGRKMVTIVDPHIKREGGYKVHQQAQSKDLYVKHNEKKGGEYEGWCWPGSVSYLDFTVARVRDYWADQFALTEYTGSTKTLYTWNDMNEPSVFNGPEVSMPKDCLHQYGLVEHRDVHNLYGFYVQMATEMGHQKRGVEVHGELGDRPFVLTRSFFAGSQRYGAVWTGDNKADWSHLEASTPMLLALNVAGITFSGADVGGFFGDPSVELLVRWYQAAAYQPFFRGHAHIDTKRREPWLFGEPHTSQIRDAIRARYALLPYVYSVFQHAAVTGVPVMRPLWVEYPTDKDVFAMEDQFLLGSDILVKPISRAGQSETRVYLPGVQPWYDVKTGVSHAAGQSVRLSTPIEYGVPVLQRGGSIIPKRERARRSSFQMAHDPFTLQIALDARGDAAGELYLDDGHSFAYTRGASLQRAFSFKGTTLRASAATASQPLSGARAVSLVSSAASPLAFHTDAVVERVVIWGLPTASRFTKAVLSQAGQADRELDVLVTAERLVVRKPGVKVETDFSIVLK